MQYTFTNCLLCARHCARTFSAQWSLNTGWASIVSQAAAGTEFSSLTVFLLSCPGPPPYPGVEQCTLPPQSVGLPLLTVFILCLCSYSHFCLKYSIPYLLLPISNHSLRTNLSSPSPRESSVIYQVKCYLSLLTNPVGRMGTTILYLSHPPLCDSRLCECLILSTLFLLDIFP